jgi:hypothetical protein
VSAAANLRVVNHSRNGNGRSGSPGPEASSGPRGRKREVEWSQYVAFVRRDLRALSRRVDSVGTLAEMAALREEFEGHLIDAVARLRHDEDWPASWTDIGRAFGVGADAARKRFGKVGGIRRRGGQPGNWR